MNYTQKQVEQVVALKKQGVSHRDIAEVVFKRRTMASTVWYILNEHLYQKEEKALQKGPRVLIMDIETAPEIVYSWGRWKQNVGVSQVIQRSYMLTWAAKWLGDKETKHDAIPYYKDPTSTNDYEIVASMWDLLDAADVVVAHNGLRFDIAYLNSRFAAHGLGMPSPYKVVDTLKIAKKYFRFAANSLAELCTFFEVEHPKLSTDFSLWSGCMGGDLDAWDKMITYNIRDIEALEEVYLKLRPYDKQAPNFALYYDDDAVRDPVTGSTEVVKLDKLAYTATSAFESFRSDEGHVFRSSKAVRRVKTTNSQ